MLLMMVVGLTAFAQYPTTRKLNGKQVVIMTVPQAEQIDKQFEVLNDSIAELNSRIKTKTHEIYNEALKKVFDNPIIIDALVDNNFQTDSTSAVPKLFSKLTLPTA